MDPAVETSGGRGRMKRAKYLLVLLLAAGAAWATGLKSRYVWDRYWTNQGVPSRDDHCRRPGAPGCDDSPELECLAGEVAALLHNAGWRVASAESVTGGSFASALTGTEQAGAVYAFGLVTYATASKNALLDVTARSDTAVISEDTAREMVEGLAARAKAINALLRERGDSRPVNVLVAFTGASTTWLDFRPQVFVGLKVPGRAIEVISIPLRDDLAGRADERTVNIELATRAGLELLRERLTSRGGLP